MNHHQDNLDQVDAQEEDEEGHVPNYSFSRFQADSGPEGMVV